MTFSGTVRVAVVQAASVGLDRERSLEKAHDLTARAAAQCAELVVFPEVFISGYPRGSDFGIVVGNRTEEGREAFRRYADAAVEVPGSATAALGEMAAEHGIFLVMGVTEREGGTLYCSVLFSVRMAPTSASTAKFCPPPRNDSSGARATVQPCRSSIHPSARSAR
jgi:predicted amidohydrolase